MTRTYEQTVLADAADILEEQGWVQGHFSSLDGRLCALGAIRRRVTEDTQELSTPVRRAAKVLARHLGLIEDWDRYARPEDEVAFWNDLDGNTAANVVAALRAAADNPEVAGPAALVHPHSKQGDSNAPGRP